MTLLFCQGGGGRGEEGKGAVKGEIFKGRFLRQRGADQWERRIPKVGRCMWDYGVLL